MARGVARNPGSTTRDDQFVTLCAWITITGIVVYVVLTVIAQLSPPHYSPIHDAESELAVGPYGYVMTIAFVVRGVLSGALLIALCRGLPDRTRSRTGLILLGVWAVGAVLLAMFPTDLRNGPHTIHGGIHLVVALVAFVSIAVGEVALSRRMAAASRPSPGSRIVTLLSYWSATTLVLFFFTTPWPRVFGLFERLFLSAALLWMLVTAITLLAHRETASRDRTGDV